MTLYERLGLKPGATFDAVRAAYRSLAKAAHPDAGGTEEEFMALQEAHDVLTDPERRKRYDETGEIIGKPVDFTDQMAMKLVNDVLQKLLTDDIEVSCDDVIEEIRDAISDELKQLRATEAVFLRAAERAERWAKRSLSKLAGAERNRMKPALEWHARQAREAAEKMGRTIAAHERAIEIVLDHDFDRQLSVRGSVLQGATSTDTSTYRGGFFGFGGHSMGGGFGGR